MPSIVELLARLAGVGGSAVPGENGTLAVRVPRTAAALGWELIARKAEVVAHLATPAGWDAGAAIGLMEAADAAVERHSCRRADPLIQAAVVRACGAYRHRDAGELARACAEVALLAASAAGGRAEPVAA